MTKKALSAYVLAGVLGAFPAALVFAQGYGSGTNNPDLLRGSYSPFCEPVMLCSYASQSQPAPQPAFVVVKDPAELPPTPSAAVSAPLPVLAHAPAEIAPAYVSASAWRPRYGIALRGSFIHSGGASRYEAALIPNLGLDYRGGSTTIGLSANATLVQTFGDNFRFGGAEVAASLSQVLGEATRLGLDASISIAEDNGGIASGAMTAPLSFDAALDATLSRQMGRFDVTGSLGVARTLAEDSLFSGTVSPDDRTRIGGGIRLGYALTPALDGFVAADVGREIFDRDDVGLGASRSGWGYAARAGLSADWNDVLTVEGSLGYGWRSFDAGNVVDTQSWLYGVALDYTSNAALGLNLAFDTAIVPGTGAVAANLEHALSFELAYRLNEWMRLRGTGSAIWTVTDGQSEIASRYRAGLGTDIALGPNSTLAFDYAYGWRDTGVVGAMPETEHRLSAGISLQY